jgi:hexosaminidase
MIKSALGRILFMGVYLLCSLPQGQSQTTDPYSGIIPAPAILQKATGHFTINASTVVTATKEAEPALQLLQTYYKQEYKKTLKASKTAPAVNVIVLTEQGAASLPAEGYQLTVTASRITIIGKGAGLFYGVQSLLQLFPAQPTAALQLPCVTIKDQPRFGYRGFMLDVSRHFFTVGFIKQYLDLMATYKLNYFHWHLVDNEGWRIEIKKYPKLTSIGAERMQGKIAWNRDWPDSTSYEGFYTQEQIKDVVAYAAKRYITVIPEIEMPAHSVAALRAYPEYKCPLPDTSTNKNKRLYDFIFCPTENTFRFFEDVVTEIIPLFPAPYVHIGGDEANKLPWKESAFCQDLIKKLDLKDEHGLQSYFIQRMEKFINAKGKTIIGWDEILEGGLAPNAIVMSWRGESGGIASAQNKHQVIMTPNLDGMYFDYAYSKSPTEPMTIGHYLPLTKTYSYDPVPAVLKQEEQQYVWGVQGNVWTEFIGTPAKVEYMSLPRLLALAEISWTPVANKNYTDFAEVRMPGHLARFDAKGYCYRVPEPVGIKDDTLKGPSFNFMLRPLVPGAKIYYTLNGLTPGETDWEYSGPVNISVPAGETRELKTLVVSPAGRRSVVNHVIMKN